MITFNINLNGTDSRALLDQWINVVDATDALLESLERAIPHGRDFQGAEAGAYEAARTEHMSLATMAHMIRNAAMATAIDINNQRIDRGIK